MPPQSATATQDAEESSLANGLVPPHEADTRVTTRRGVARARQGQASAMARMLDAVWRSRTEYQRLGVAALTAVVLVGGAGGAIALGDGGDDSAEFASAQIDAGATPTAHDVCTAQIMAIVIHLFDDGLGEEIRVNGVNDAHYRAASTLWGMAAQERYTVGDTVMGDHVHYQAGQVCTSDLHDAIRANYPTDGTYPGE